MGLIKHCENMCMTTLHADYEMSTVNSSMNEDWIRHNETAQKTAFGSTVLKTWAGEAFLALCTIMMKFLFLIFYKLQDGSVSIMQ